MNKITKSAVNTVLLTTITGLKIQIDLIYLQWHSPLRLWIILNYKETAKAVK
jgi:hypothetical protein